MKTTGVILILMLLTNSLVAQNNLYQLIRANEKRNIAVKSLIGIWTSNDSIKRKIEFVEDAIDVRIEPKHGMNNYRFRKKVDSVCVNGVASGWPPHYCFLNLLEENTLEIKYYHVYDTTLVKLVLTKK
jgi:hypothetical protein